jgi:hypothetical protein
LFIKAKEKSVVNIVSYNLQGRELYREQRNIDEGTYSMTLPHAGAGIYIYKVISGTSELVLKSCSIVPGGTVKSRNGLFKWEYVAKAKSTRLFNDVTITNPDTSGMEIKLISQDAGTVTDIDGNVYQAVKIGNQVWTVENLRTTRYNDGTAIPYVTDNSAWANLTTPGYCYYFNDSTANADKYGVLYNWYTVNTGKLSPAGWHVPDTNSQVNGCKDGLEFIK